MIAVARQAWESVEYAPYRKACEDYHLEAQRRFVEEVNQRAEQDELQARLRREQIEEEVKQHLRGGDGEVSRELPPPPPSRERGGGGFTSING